MTVISTHEEMHTLRKKQEEETVVHDNFPPKSIIVLL